MHKTDERVAIADLERLTRIYEAILNAYFEKGRRVTVDVAYMRRSIDAAFRLALRDERGLDEIRSDRRRLLPLLRGDRSSSCRSTS